MKYSCFIFFAALLMQNFCMTSAFCNESPVRGIMFSVNYGRAENEIAVSIPKIPPQEGILSSGPQDFWVDNLENVYFTAGDRIKKFDKEGRLIFMTRRFQDIGNDFYYMRMIFVTCGAIYADFLYWIVKIDIDTGEIITSEKTHDYKSLYNNTHLGRVVSSSISDFQYNDDTIKRPPFIDKYGYRYEYDIVYTKGKELVINKYHHVKNYDKIEYRIDLEKHLATSYDIKSAYIDQEGRFYIWGLLDKEKRARLDKYGYLEYKYDIIVQHFDKTGNVIDEVIFIGAYPFDGANNLRHIIRFAPNGDFYTIYFHLDKLDVVKYTWEHNKNNNENVSE
jgi:hypothetical protein